MRYIWIFLILFVSIILITYHRVYNDTALVGEAVVTIYPDDNYQFKVKPEKPFNDSQQHIDNIIYGLVWSNDAKSRMSVFDLHPDPEQPLQEKLVAVDKHEFSDSIIDVMLNEIELNPMEAPINTAQPATSSLNIKYINPDTNPLAQIHKKESLNNKYWIMLASVKTESDGYKIWNAIKDRYSRIIGHVDIRIRKIEQTNNSIYYAVLVGSYRSLNKANLVCKRLANYSQYCAVVTD